MVEAEDEHHEFDKRKRISQLNLTQVGDFSLRTKVAKVINTSATTIALKLYNFKSILERTCDTSGHHWKSLHEKFQMSFKFRFWFI